MNDTRDITQPFFEDRERFRHTDSSWGRAIAYGLQHKRGVWLGQQDEKAVARRRARNKAARASRKINRRNH